MDVKIKTGDVGVRTGINSPRIPNISVIDGQVWQSYRRDQSAVIEENIMLAVEVVSPGTEQISRDYTDEVIEYQNTGIPKYWIIDPVKQIVTVLVLQDGNYIKTEFTGDERIKSEIFSKLNVSGDEIISAN